MKKIKLAIVFGGPSAEHDVSIVSAKNIFNATDKNKYEIFLLGITQKGDWKYLSDEKELTSIDFKNKLDLNKTGNEVFLIKENDKCNLINNKTKKTTSELDVAFNICHGPYGEDGRLQGFFDLVKLPYVGCNTTASAICMDKAVFKQIMAARGLPQVSFAVLKNNDALPSFDKIKSELGTPFFVKPANMGSSVGVSKVKAENEYIKAIEEAFKWDPKILIEQAAIGQEIECAVFSDGKKIITSPIGEIINSTEFYSYDSKYINDKASTFALPAKISEEVSQKTRELAENVFKLVSARHMLRVDFFYTQKGELLINEANSLPGFTSISMYPKMMEAAGIKYADLIDRMIISALHEPKS